MARSKNRLRFTKSSLERLVPPKRPDGGAPCCETWFDTEKYRADYLIPRDKLMRDESTRARTIVIYETKQKVSEGMANRVVGFLSALYGWAGRTIDPATTHRYYTGVNPAALVTKYSESPGVGRPLSDEEMKRFLEAVAKLDPYWRDFFLALTWTGARLSNVCAMRWGQLDLEARIWSIPSKTTKTHRPYRVALSSPLMALLAVRQRESTSEWVFPSKSRSGHLEEPKKVWYAILKSARIKDLRLHDLRTTAASCRRLFGTDRGYRQRNWVSDADAITIEANPRNLRPASGARENPVSWSAFPQWGVVWSFA